VLEIVALSCDEAYARFSRETQACNLKSRCAKWGSKTVQCLVLDPNSIGIAHDIQHILVGNQGVLRQIDDTNRIARFCRSSQLGTTETVQLSTGESVSCIYNRTWSKYPDAVISDRAAATSPAAAADAATDAAAAAVPAAAAVVAAAAAVASTCLQTWPNFSSLSNDFDQAKRKWLAAHCSPRSAETKREGPRRAAISPASGSSYMGSDDDKTHEIARAMSQKTKSKRGILCGAGSCGPLGGSNIGRSALLRGGDRASSAAESGSPVKSRRTDG
jgi:hypothetical protein